MRKFNKLNEFSFPEEWKRKVIIYSICAGMTNNDIVDKLKLPLRTIQRIRKQLIESEFDVEAVGNRKSQDRTKQKVRSKNFITNVQQMINNDPSVSIREISRQLGSSESTVRLCVREDIRYKSYKMQSGQLLTEKMKIARIEKSKKLLQKIKHPLASNMLWFFSDEKIFCQDQSHNRQNTRWLAQSREDVPRIMKTKYPAHIMVFGVISSEGHVMPPHIFEEGLRVNQAVYINVLSTVVKPWIDKVAAGRPYVFQQDSAPAHTARKTQEWISVNFYDHVTPDLWPPNSPDCNPLDYYLWGVVERLTNKTACNTKGELIRRICQAFRTLPADTVKIACSRFRNRVESVINAEGGFIE